MRPPLKTTQAETASCPKGLPRCWAARPHFSPHQIFTSSEPIEIELPRRCLACRNCKECRFYMDSLSFKENTDNAGVIQHYNTSWEAGPGLTPPPPKFDHQLRWIFLFKDSRPTTRDSIGIYIFNYFGSQDDKLHEDCSMAIFSFWCSLVPVWASQNSLLRGRKFSLLVLLSVICP